MTNTVFGKNCSISDKAVIKNNCIIGDNTVIEDFVLIEEYVTIGDGCTVSAGAKIGTKPFVTDDHIEKQKYLGHDFRLIIGESVFIGNNSVIQIGVGRNSVIGNGTLVNNLCNLGHDLLIGENCTIGLSSSISGFSELGNEVYIGPGVTISNRVTIGNSCFVGIGSLVLKDIPAFTKVVGRPAKNINEQRKKKHLARYLRDHSIARRIRTKLKGFRLVRKIYNSLRMFRKKDARG